MQVTVIGIMVLSTMELLTVTTGLAHLMVQTGITWTSILRVLILAITITVLTGSLWGVSKTIKVWIFFRLFYKLKILFMTTYDNLPVYKTSYDLLLLVFNAVKEFKKEYKYTLWDSIKKEIINLISNIYKANSKIDKKINISTSREKVELLRLYFRLSKDLKIINLNKYIDINLLLESISKQLYAWEKSLTIKK
jgi:hypothetical protein